MKRCFIRGLWGDNYLRPYEKVRRDVANAVVWPHKPSPMQVYCYGVENEAYLKTLGVTPRRMSKEPVVNFTGGTDRNIVQDYTGSFGWGMSTWRHKLDVLERALSEYEEVVWLDWDVKQFEPMPADFWERLRMGRCFQAAIKQYRRIQLGHRRIDKRKIPHGAFIYCRSLPAIREIIEIHRAMPLAMDEHAYMVWIDRQTPWTGVDGYKAAGWEPWCYYHAESVLILERVVFAEHMNRRAWRKVKNELLLRKGAVG